jgi:uncharacterized protein
MAETRELNTGECQALLRSGVAGRVAVSTPTGPHIVPVNYTVVENSIVFRTAPYSLLGTYGRESMLAFEIDGFDEVNERGWSVQARGRVEAVTDRAELSLIREIAEPQPWAGGARSLYLRLRWSELSGRKLSTGRDPVNEQVATTGA